MRLFYENEILKPPEIVFPRIAEPEKAMQWQKIERVIGLFSLDPLSIVANIFKEGIWSDTINYLKKPE